MHVTSADVCAVHISVLISKRADIKYNQKPAYNNMRQWIQKYRKWLMVQPPSSSTRAQIIWFFGLFIFSQMEEKVLVFPES